MRLRRYLLAAAHAVGLSLALCACGAGSTAARISSPDQASSSLAIPGAPGYYTATGPAGRPFSVGQPWGAGCQPIRFTVEQSVPDEVYDQVVLVVAEARQAGLDVTLESRQFMWRPASLYYPAGVTQSDVQRLGIFAGSEAPPKRANGQDSRVNIGWDAALQPDGAHERLTSVQGHLHLVALGQPAEIRTTIRQIIAMTQGVRSSDASDSGVVPASAVDRFSAQDIAPMKIMSGCGEDATSVVSTVPFH